jgi:FlaG/FlaF family flagellin (archaellin)
MQEPVKTSFIPKASLTVERERRPKSNDTIGLVNIATGIILVLVLVAAGGVFGITSYTTQSIKNKKADLVRAREAFQPATIQYLSRLDTRIKTAGSLLASHVALSRVFDDLESRTLSTVRFESFAFDTTTSGKITLAMDGTAQSFNAVAQQSVQLSKSPIIKDPIFSGVNINTVGAVSFTLSAVIDPATLGYSPSSSSPSPGAASTTPGSTGSPQATP